MLETVIGIGGATASIYSAIASFGTGKFQKRLLSILEQQKAEIVRLTDHILYSPNSAPISVDAQTIKTFDLRQTREIVEPLQQALRADVLVSGVLHTSKTLEEQFSLNPWNCLDGVQPIELVKFERSNDWVPLFFIHRNIPFVGWQKIGILRSLGLEFPNNEFSKDIKTWEISASEGSRYSSLRFEGERSRRSKVTANASSMPLMKPRRKIRNPKALAIATEALAFGGSAEDQFQIGMMYDKGYGVSQDYNQAALWLCKSAKQGYVLAQMRLANIYLLGSRVEEAMMWYRKAIKTGNDYHLDGLYLRGFDVERNLEKAFVLCEEYIQNALVWYSEE